jgi:hypothetical protein
MAQSVGTGHVFADIGILAIGWGGPQLLNISLVDLGDIITPISQVSTTLIVLATAILRYRKSKNDK